MNIGLQTDHGGYILKEPILEALRNSGHEVRDFGAYNLNPRMITRTLSSRLPGQFLEVK